MLERAIQVRRHLHQIPETGLCEVKTQAALKSYLADSGAVLYDAIFETALVAHFEFVPGAPAIAFRADMDALSLMERNTHDFVSNHPGAMHACGHDGHMTMLVLLADYLKANPLKQHNVVLLFQPAEEGPGGAKGMLEAGIVERFNIKEVYGIHLFPGLDAGVIGTKAGPLMAATSEMRIRFKGVPSHGAQPHVGRDAIVAGASFVMNAQTIVSRNVSPMASGVVSFGIFNGGERVNIVAPEVFIEGTMRSFDKEVHALIQKRILALAEATALAHEVTAEVRFDDMYPAVINDATLAKTALEIIPGAVEVPAEMLAEDFSYFGEAVPSLFMFLGIRSENNGQYPLHSNLFDFDEKVLLAGLDSFVRILAYKELNP